MTEAESGLTVAVLRAVGLKQQGILD